MKNGDMQHTSVPNKNLSSLWFGTSLAQFLEVELTDFPERRVAALRLFIVALIIALVNETQHVPPLGAIALLICLSYDAYANSGQALAFGLRQLGYIIITTGVSVFALMFAGNEAWLLLPFVVHCYCARPVSCPSDRLAYRYRPMVFRGGAI
jgi:multidrug resistance protein MdtO